MLSRQEYVTQQTRGTIRQLQTWFARNRKSIACALPLLGLMSGSLTGCASTPQSEQPASTQTPSVTVANTPALTSTVQPTAVATSQPEVTATSEPSATPTVEPSATLPPTPEGMVNGFYSKDGKLFDWEDGHPGEVTMPAELKNLMTAEPISNVDKDLQGILGEGTMSIVEGRPVFQININGQPINMAEYKDGKWQVADFQVMADNTHIQQVENLLHSAPDNGTSSQGRSGTAFAFINAQIVGVKVENGQMASMFAVGHGDKVIVISSGGIWFTENKLDGNNSVQSDWGMLTTVPVPVGIDTAARVLYMLTLGRIHRAGAMVEVFNPDGLVTTTALRNQVIQNEIPIPSTGAFTNTLASLWRGSEFFSTVVTDGTQKWVQYRDYR